MSLSGTGATTTSPSLSRTCRSPSWIRCAQATSSPTTRVRRACSGPMSWLSTRSTRPLPPTSPRCWPTCGPPIRGARIVEAASPVTLGEGPPLSGKRVLVIEDGPTITHGGMPFGAGTVAARHEGAAEIVYPRPYAVGSIAGTYVRYPSIGAVLPAMGYGDEQLAELGATVRRADCDVVVIGTPMDLARLVDLGHPSRRVTYQLSEIGTPTLKDILEPLVQGWARPQRGWVAYRPQASISAPTAEPASMPPTGSVIASAGVGPEPFMARACPTRRLH